jgi:hypothetical protein
MALHWNIGDIANFKELCHINVRTNDKGEEICDIHPVTDALIWSCMSVGMGEITEQNYEEFYRRMVALAKIHGPMLRNKDGSMAISLADVRAHIGLRCNVSFQHDLEFQMGLGRRVNDHAGSALVKARDDLAVADAAEQVVEDASKGD